MTLERIPGSGNQYRVQSVSDLDIANVTNLYNTGSPATYTSTHHVGAATIYIPQASLFSDGGGRYVDLSDFGFVRELFEGEIVLPAGRYTISDLMATHSGVDRWTVPVSQALLDQGSDDYVNRAYIFNSQAYVLDGSSILNVDSLGNFNFENYEIRMNRDHGLISEDFDFEGGWSAYFFNLIHGAEIASPNGQAVTFIYEGSGLTGENYTRADYVERWARTDYDERASEGVSITAPWTVVAYQRIVNELSESNLLTSSQRITAQNELVLRARTLIDENRDMLYNEAFVDELFRVFGSEAAIDALGNNNCFLEGVDILMWPFGEGRFETDSNCTEAHSIFNQSKPIKDIALGDYVASFDASGLLVAGKVVRLLRGRAKIILDFFGTFVTPGHVYRCINGRGLGSFEPLIDILRNDGVVQSANGKLLRATTGLSIDDPRDRFVWAIAGATIPDGSGICVREKGRLRLGTRFITQDGRDFCIADLIEIAGGVVTDEGLIRIGDDEMPFHWSFSEQLPKPEDYILQRSGTTLVEIYRAAEWEGRRPSSPAPMLMDGAPVQPFLQSELADMPRNMPLALRGGAYAAAKRPMLASRSTEGAGKDPRKPTEEDRGKLH